MKKFLILIALLIAPFSEKLYAENHKAVTPYGDYCPLCSPYGACRKEPVRKEALKALRAYFRQQGFEVRIIEDRGRFIRAEVLRGKTIVDRIIFDKRTGRIRSIY